MDVNLNKPLNDTVPLTDDQEVAIDQILTYLDHPTQMEYKLGGYAGTGKTTVLKELLKDLSGRCHLVVCAFTGKAVNVLQRKGVPAQTMHSLMYNVIDNGDGTFDFSKKTVLEDKPRLIIVDEASMVSTDLYHDLCSFKTKRLFVGDPGQLEPVGDNPNLMREPTFILSHIHRQAQKSPIIRFATAVRTGARPLHQIELDDANDGLLVKDHEMRASDYLAADQIICATNDMRKRLNTSLRSHKHHPTTSIVEGDKLICLRNNRALNMFNGMILYIDKIVREGSNFWEVHLHDETLKKYQYIKLWTDPFRYAKVDDTRIPKGFLYADYGYVITCHKSQGSEWNSVIVHDKWMPPHVWDTKRWRYTAITRAAKRLTFCC